MKHTPNVPGVYTHTISSGTGNITITSPSSTLSSSGSSVGWSHGTISNTTYTYSSVGYDLKEFLNTYSLGINSLEDYNEVQKKLKEKLKILLTNETKVGKILYEPKDDK